MKKNILFDNTERNFETIKAELQELNPECNLTDEQVWDYMSCREQYDWDDMKSLMEGFDDNGWLVLGTNGRWDGTRRGGFVAETFDEVLNKVCKDCDYITIFCDEYSRLFVEASHHDGTNFVQVMPLTAAGKDLYDTWNSCTIEYYHSSNPRRYRMEYDSYDEEQIHKVLLSKTYSRKRVDIFEQ